MRTFPFSRLCLLFLSSFLSVPSFCQLSMMDMEQLTVNENVTTVITASEPVRLVDISTDKVVGDKPIGNVIRLKPKDGNHEDGEVLAIVTVVTERYRTQYALLYTSRMEEAVSDKEVLLSERTAFRNPAVSLSTEDMVRYARRIWTGPAMYRNIKTNKHHLTMRLNNIYTVGEFIFLDFSVENHINLRFDIDELRFKLSDKKQQKSTIVQDIQLEPVLVLDDSKYFTRGYRNVVVLKKMTFPNDKVLTLELSEKQISGRTIYMQLDYEDILAADSFSTLLLKEE